MPYALCPMPARAPHVTEKGYIIVGLYSGTLKVERETQAYTEFIITLPKL